MDEQEREIRQALRNMLPEYLHQQVEQLAAAIIYVLRNTQKQEVSLELSQDIETAQQILWQLAGKTLESKQGIISFGESNQIGDVNIRNIAGRDNIEVHVQFENVSKEARITNGVLLCQITCIAFVDIMRLLYVSSSEAANTANRIRYNEFIRIARDRINDFQSDTVQFTSTLDANIFHLSRGLKNRFHTALRQLEQTEGNLSNTRGIFALAKELSIIIETYCHSLAEEYFAQQKATFEAVRQLFSRRRSPLPLLYSDDRHVFLRSELQNLALSLHTPRYRRIYSISEDFDQDFAVQYFLIDQLLLHSMNIG